MNEEKWDIMVSRNFFNEVNLVNIGEMLKDIAGGGGHVFVGGAQIIKGKEGEKKVQRIINIMKEQNEYLVRK